MEDPTDNEFAFESQEHAPCLPRKSSESADLQNAIKSWVKDRGKDAKCEDLLIIFKQMGLNEFAKLLENFCGHRGASSFAIKHSKNGSSKTVAPSRKGRRKKMLLASCIFCIFLACFGGGSTIFMCTYQGGSKDETNCSMMVESDIFSSTNPSTVSSQSPYANRNNPFCRPIRKYSGMNPAAQRVTPDWSRNVLDFCNSQETHLLLMETDFLLENSTPVIFCPERVTALEIYVNLNPFQLQKLCFTFCSLQTISFIGENICHDEGIIKESSFPKSTAKSIRLIKWRNLNFCANIFRLVYQSIHLPNLISMNFRCVAFETPDFSILESILADSPKVKTVSCSDSGMCLNFNLNVTSGFPITIEQENCDVDE